MGANMCHVHGMLNNDKKNVNCSCHLPNLPTAWDIGSSSSSSSSMALLMQTSLGGAPLGDVALVIGTVKNKLRLLVNDQLA